MTHAHVALIASKWYQVSVLLSKEEQCKFECRGKAEERATCPCDDRDLYGKRVEILVLGHIRSYGC